jgi:hypothetical protein
MREKIILTYYTGTVLSFQPQGEIVYSIRQEWGFDPDFYASADLDEQRPPTKAQGVPGQIPAWLRALR